MNNGRHFVKSDFSCVMRDEVSKFPIICFEFIEKNIISKITKPRRGTTPKTVLWLCYSNSVTLSLCYIVYRPYFIVCHTKIISWRSGRPENASICLRVFIQKYDIKLWERIIFPLYSSFMRWKIGKLNSSENFVSSKNISMIKNEF